jgi:beta-phosphoglucomutase-like phosphatase (HAD superfamily)
MRITAVVFDMDGLMFDTEALYKVAWQRAAAECGFDLTDATYATLIGRPAEDCDTDLLSLFGPSLPLHRFRRRRTVLWQAVVHQQGVPHKRGLLPLLDYLTVQHVPTAVATMSTFEATDLSLRRAGLRDCFGAVVTADDVVRGKPSPDVYLEAARRLDRDPRHCLALEDSDAGITSACAAGMVAVCVPDFHRPSAATVSAAFRVLESLVDAREILESVLHRD